MSNFIFLTAFFILSINIYSQNFSISGKITDEKGIPLAGVNIISIESGKGTASGSSGTYILEGIAPGSCTIRFSMLGFKSEVLQISVYSDTVINLALAEAMLESEQVVVTSSKYEQKLKDLPVSAGVIGSDAISNRNLSNLDEVLRYAPGVSVTYDQVSIRGSGGYSRGAGTRVLVALDGVPFYTGDTGEIIWDIVPVTEIKRIEIIKGPSSSLYGSTAIGGVINIITKDFSDKPVTYIKTHAGFYDKPSYDEWDWSGRTRWFNGLTLSHSNAGEKFGFAASFTRLESEGYRQSGFYHRYLGYLKGMYRLTPASSLTLIANSINQRNGNFLYWKDSQNVLVPPDAEQGQRIETNRYMFALIYKNALTAGNLLDFKNSYYNTHWRDETASRNESKAQLFRSELQLTTNFSPGIYLISGAEGVFSTVSSNIFSNPTAFGTGLYSQLNYSFAFPLRIEAGARFDYNKTDTLAGSSALSPKLALSYSLNDNLILRASAAAGFRAPSLAETYTRTSAGGIVIKPNPALKPEKNTAFEAGVKFLPAEFLEIDAALFHTRYSNLISAGADPADGLIRFDNITDARIRGLELTVKNSFFDNTLIISLNYNYLDSRDLKLNKQLKYRPKHLFYSSAEYALKNILMGADFRYWSRVEEMDFELIDLGVVKDGEKRVPVYLLDLRAGYSLLFETMPVKITFNAHNVLNYNYVELIGNLAPIRNYSLSLELSF